MAYGIESNADTNALSTLGYKSEAKYLSSKLYRAVAHAVLKRDNGRCQSLLCPNRSAANPRPATSVVFLHKTLGAYLGIGMANVFSLCPDCQSRFSEFPPEGVFFALSGLRRRKGHSRSDIGKWYGKRFEANKELARAFLASLGERNRQFVVSLLNRNLLPAFYRAYLGLEDLQDASSNSRT